MSANFKITAIFLFLFFAHSQLLAQQKDSLKVYLKCRNDISVSYLFKTSISPENGIGVRGARLIENKDNDRIAIIPDSAVVIIELKKNGQVMAKSVLYSKKPPRPIFEVKISGKSYYSFDSKVTVPLPSGISINPISDEAFKQMVPKDAVYKILKWEVSLIHNGRSIKRLEFSQADIFAGDLVEIRSVASANDIIQVKILEMKRQNAVGEMIDQELSSNSISFTVN